jgi:hypothetical protein
MLKDRVSELEAYGTSVERPADCDAFWAVNGPEWLQPLAQ